MRCFLSEWFVLEACVQKMFFEHRLYSRPALKPSPASRRDEAGLRQARRQGQGEGRLRGANHAARRGNETQYPATNDNYTDTGEGACATFKTYQYQVKAL